MLKYQLALADDEATAATAAAAAQVKAAAAPRAVTEADIAKFGDSISSKTHIMVGGKPELLSKAKTPGEVTTGKNLMIKYPNLTGLNENFTYAYDPENGTLSSVKTKNDDLNADEAHRLGLAKNVFPNMSVEDILSKNLLYDPRVEKVMSSYYGSRAYTTAYQGAAGREPFKEPPKLPKLVGTAVVNGVTLYKMDDGRLYDNPRGE
jgi:hypothetical protein